MASVSIGACDHLEVMPVKMEWMLSWVVIVEDDVDHVVLVQHKCIRVVTVHPRIGRSIPRRHDAVQRGDNGTDVRDIVEEGAVNRSASLRKIELRDTY